MCSWKERSRMRLTSTALVLLFAAALAGCNDTLESAAYDTPRVSNKVAQPLPARLIAEIQKKGMDRNSPIMIRIFKEEGKLEVWKAKTNNRFDKVVEYDICAWSGRLGPKVKEGDRQAPEGFYPLTPYHLNPNSKYFLAINTGFPNQFDRANGRTGSHLMIHGACSSSGCYSMTDAQMLEIYAFARDAFKGGQHAVQLQAFPFRMTPENLAKYRSDPHIAFWKNLKEGTDYFEVTGDEQGLHLCTAHETLCCAAANTHLADDWRMAAWQHSRSTYAELARYARRYPHHVPTCSALFLGAVSPQERSFSH